MIDSKLNDILNSYDCNDSAYVISDYIKNNIKIPVKSIGLRSFYKLVLYQKGKFLNL